jgi:hypothetical protein
MKNFRGDLFYDELLFIACNLLDGLISFDCIIIRTNSVFFHVLCPYSFHVEGLMNQSVLRNQIGSI